MLQIGDIIAILGYHDAIWFAIVTQEFFFSNDVISINYFEKIVNTNGKEVNKYYYLSFDEVTISKNTIICTGITFRPVWNTNSGLKHKINKFKLITSLEEITRLNGKEIIQSISVFNISNNKPYKSYINTYNNMTVQELQELFQEIQVDTF